MILISHRGNIDRIIPESENNPEYVLSAIEKGYDCEIDVWYKEGQWYLGHDYPEYGIELSFLKNNKLWCHAKNLQALQQLLKNNIHCFWHQEDDYTITSKGFIWTYPGNKLTKDSICVMPETNSKNFDISNCLGICSDEIKKFKELLNET